MKILLLEDDESLASYLSRKLGELASHVRHASDLATALRFAEAETFDLYIVDRMLPDGDGETWLRQRREASDETPALFLTALGSVADKVGGLRYADDYLVKPFEFDELWARVQSLLRRSSKSQLPARLDAKWLSIDRMERRVFKDEEELSLKPMEYRLLEFLASHAGQTVTRKMLLQEVWGFSFDPSTNIVETYISRVRAQVDKPGEASMIETVRGEGYRLAIQ